MYSLQTHTPCFHQQEELQGYKSELQNATMHLRAGTAFDDTKDDMLTSQLHMRNSP